MKSLKNNLMKYLTHYISMNSAEKYLNIPNDIKNFFGYGEDGARRFRKTSFIRYATQQEIDEFKIKNITIKYNL